jgi:hypothetical protein
MSVHGTPQGIDTHALTGTVNGARLDVDVPDATLYKSMAELTHPRSLHLISLCTKPVSILGAPIQTA